MLINSPNPIDVGIGERIRERRKALGMSQEQLAVQVGISHQQIQKYEAGTNHAGVGRLRDIAGALDVPVSYFFVADRPSSLKEGATGVGGVILDLSSFLLTKDGIELNRAFLKIKDGDVRRSIVNLARALAKERDAGREIDSNWQPMATKREKLTQ